MTSFLFVDKIKVMSSCARRVLMDLEHFGLLNQLLYAGTIFRSYQMYNHVA